MISARITRARLGQWVTATPTATPQKPLAQGVGDEDEQHDVGHAHHEVDEPGHHGVHLLAAQGRRRAEHEGDDRSDTPAASRPTSTLVARPAERAQEHVAPHLVGAEGVREARRLGF